jgi:exonuclease SbcC
MNLMSMTVKNFKSYGPEPQILDLTKVDAVAIGGRNGAGKSSLIEALTFALFGKATATEIRELGDDALINDRANEAYVSVTFEKNGNQYTAERTVRRRGSGKARLTSQILPNPIADVKDVNARVESLLGMDYDTFVSSTIVRQDEMDRLTAKRPAERKETLAKIFGLQAYETMREKAHEKSWGVKNEIAGLDATKRALGEKIAQEGSVRKKLQECEDNIKKLERERKETETKKKKVEEKLDAIRENKAEFDTKASEKTALQEQLKIDEESESNARGQIRQAENAVKELESLKPRLEQRTQLDEQLQKLTQEHERLKVTVAELQQKTRGIEQKIKEESENCQKIKDYAVPECPICKRPLDEPHREQLLQEYEQKIQGLETDRDRAVKDAEEASNRLKEHVAPAIKKTQTTLNELKELDRKVGETTAAANRLPALREEASRIGKLISERKNRIGELDGALQRLGPIVQTFTALDTKRKTLEGELTGIQGNLGTEKANRDSAKEDLDEIKRTKVKHKELVEQIGDKERIRTAYELLEKEVFHKDGIPTALLMEIVPEIEQEASKILRDLSNGRMDINFKFGRKTKTGKVTEELIVEAVDQGRSHPVSRYSGGERMRINLALRLGVSEAITRRSGYRGRIETLVIDEGFGPLDEEGRRATVEILQALRHRFKKILVISHIDDVREAFETRLVVTRSVGGNSSITNA